MKKLIITIVALVAIRFVFTYAVAEIEIEQSKNEKWPAEFTQEYIKACSTEAQKQFAVVISNAGAKSEEIVEKNSAFLADSYCQCMKSRVQQARVIPTKYNKYSGAGAYEQKVKKLIGEYIVSEKGQSDIANCGQKASQDLIAAIDKQKQSPEREISSVSE